jgi:hypothetical protein
MLHADLSAALDDAPDGLGTGPVAFSAWQAAFFGPSAVAVHDHGDMTGDGLQIIGRAAHAGAESTASCSPHNQFAVS